jgi:hypothetical protein
MPIRGYSYTETDWQVVSCKLKGATIDFHGFFIRKQEDGESIYGPRLSSQEILKLTFDRKEGKVIKQLGYNNRKYEVGTNRTPWIKWRTGIMTAPPRSCLQYKGRSLCGRVQYYWTRPPPEQKIGEETLFSQNITSGPEAR